MVLRAIFIPPEYILLLGASLLNTAIQNKNLAHKNLAAGGNHVPRLLKVFGLLPLLAYVEKVS